MSEAEQIATKLEAFKVSDSMRTKFVKEVGEITPPDKFDKLNREVELLSQKLDVFLDANKALPSFNHESNRMLSKPQNDIQRYNRQGRHESFRTPPPYKHPHHVENNRSGNGNGSIERETHSLTQLEVSNLSDKIENGFYVLKLLIDTGSTISILNTDFAKSLPNFNPLNVQPVSTKLVSVTGALSHFEGILKYL
ncbi:hypothetical protein DPMN_115218 [Dreissena polymorpha]|uniref:Uncharacterized protein n=1 Tax=Dreissena polymorpha TaxID=45954 RepID=A0A9D4QS97_DREPO|nr:hypothetical protein DPMN_115218 [Dreissena polymorpha]